MATYSETIRDMVIDGFVGEHRHMAEHRMPAQVSPDALNIDYRKQTVRKRKGPKRIHAQAVLSGAVIIRPQHILDIGHVSAYEFGGAFWYQFVVRPEWTTIGDDDFTWLIYHNDGGLNADLTEGFGVCLKKVSGDYAWHASIRHTGGATLTVTGPTTGATSPRSGTKQVVTAGLDTDDKLKLYVDGTLVGESAAIPGTESYDWYTTVFRIGPPSTGDERVWFTIDELRLWSVTMTYDLDSSYRELTPAEYADAALVGYWRLNRQDFNSGTMEYSDYAVSSNAAKLIGTIATTTHFQASGMVQGEGNFNIVTGLIPAVVDGQVTQLLLASDADVFVWDYTTGTLDYLFTAAALGTTRWRGVGFEGWTVLFNGASENLRYIPGSGLYQLSFDAPTGPVDVSVVAGVGSMTAGDYGYLFTFYDSVNAIESAVGAFTTTITVSTNDAVDIGSVTNPIPSTRQTGVDKVRIYRTKADGSVYYLLTTVDNGTDIVTNSGTSDSALSTVLSPYTGYAPPSQFGFTHQGRLFMGNQDANRSRVVYTEPALVGGFYSDNYLDFDADDGDELTGGLAIGGVAVLFKRGSVWALVGSGPSTYGAQRIFGGIGCVEQATIAAGRERVYFLGHGGVYALPLPFGSGPPISITEDSQRSIFEAVEESDWPYCSGVYDAVTSRYILGLRVGGTHIAMVYDETTGAWAKWDLEAQAFTVASIEGGAPQVLCAWRYWACEFEGSDYEGLEVRNTPPASSEISGTISSATSTTITDDTLPWASDFSGLTLRVDDGLGNAQERTVVRVEGADTLHVGSAWDATPNAGWNWQLGPIKAEWRTPRLVLDDAWQGEGILQELFALWESSGSHSLTLWHEMDDGSRAQYTLAEGARLRRFAVTAENRGHELKVGIEDTAAGGGWEIAAFRLGWQQRRRKPVK